MNPVKRASGQAVHTADTAFIVNRSRVQINTTGRALRNAFPAPDALSRDPQLKHSVLCNQSKQSSDRADRCTVNPFFPDRQNRNHRKRDKGTERNEATIRPKPE